MGLSPVLGQGHGCETCFGPGSWVWVLFWARVMGLSPILGHDHGIESCFGPGSWGWVLFHLLPILSYIPVYGCVITIHFLSVPCYHFLFFSPLSLLYSQVSSIVKALHKQLKDKSIKTRQVCTIHVYTCIRIYMYIHMYMYMYLCTYTCTCTYSTCTCTYIHVHVHTLHVLIYMYIQCMYMYLYTCTCTIIMKVDNIVKVYLYVCIYIYLSMSLFVLGLFWSVNGSGTYSPRVSWKWNRIFSSWYSLLS